MNLVHTLARAGKAIENAVIRRGAARTEDNTDILTTLKKEHREAALLLKQLVESRSGAERKSLVRKLRAALIPHLRAEEKVVYDAVIALKDPDSKIDGEEGYLEHGLAETMLGKLAAMPRPMSPEFSAAAKVLKELIEHHVHEEERDIWGDVREFFTDDQRIAMNRAFEAAKRKVRVS